MLAPVLISREKSRFPGIRVAGSSPPATREGNWTYFTGLWGGGWEQDSVEVEITVRWINGSSHVKK